MARIRTIKPEFPHSESMGAVSRDARLLFILLWTICDDSGRARGNSRMLASLLYPYDDDAKDLIDIWLEELAREKCIDLYTHDGHRYLQICNWLNHQKIDKPSKSKLPEFDESSRTFANPLEASSGDQRIKGSKDQRIKGSKDPNTTSRKRSGLTAELLCQSMPGLSESVAVDYLQHRKSKKANLTETAWKTICDEIFRSGWPPDKALAEAMSRGWQGLKADWLNNSNGHGVNHGYNGAQQERQRVVEGLTGRTGSQGRTFEGTSRVVGGEDF